MEKVSSVTVDEVVEVARSAHRHRVGGLSAATEADIRSRGPYYRWMLEGAEIGELKFQPPGEPTQHPIRLHFARWFADLTADEKRQHEELTGVLLADGTFSHAPIYRRDRFVIDGAHRSLAAFDVSENHKHRLRLEVLAEDFED